jgi:hypothetical protein
LQIVKVSPWALVGYIYEVRRVAIALQLLALLIGYKNCTGPVVAAAFYVGASKLWPHVGAVAVVPRHRGAGYKKDLGSNILKGHAFLLRLNDRCRPYSVAFKRGEISP